ncbi:hypothetical protein V9K67_08940 [Paraflavisolibacter sp. H34]|uniref:hypothetical protein n=1 Tax=Huijunlia imazamoxiresistens TaxID=3127457 RepID=UPI0030193AEA
MQALIDILFLFFFSLVYVYFFLSFFYREKAVFFFFLICFIAFYDIVFISISPYVSPIVLNIIKSWQEYLFLFLLFLLMMPGKNKSFYLNKFDRTFLFSFILLTAVGSVGGMMNGTPAGQVFLGWRMYLLPFLWSFLLYKTSIFNRISSRFVINLLISVTVFIVLFAIYQQLTFDNDLKRLWFYDYINRLNPIEDHEFDFIRDGQLRVTSIFVSPLIYASFLSFSMLMLIFRIFIKREPLIGKVVPAMLLVLLGYGQVLSRTRIGFIILLVGLCCSFLVYFRPSSKFLFSFFVPIAFLSVTFISLIFGVTDDLSALGRLIQYSSLPSNFVPMGMGFGAEMTNVYFDSFYISVILLFGIFVPLYLRFYLVPLRKMNEHARYLRYEERDSSNRILYYSCYGFFFSFLYTFGFHFTIGSATVQLFYLLLFFFVSRFEKLAEKKPQKMLAL